MSIFNFLRKKPEKQQINKDLEKEQIRRQIEILLESQTIMNNSNSVTTVVHRYNLALSALSTLLRYTETSIKEAGFVFPNTIEEMRKDLINNHDVIIHKAIQRNITNEIDSSKTKNGKLSTLEKVYYSIRGIGNLNQNNITTLEHLYSEYKKELQAPSSVTTENVNGFFTTTTTVYSDGSFHVSEALSNDAEKQISFENEILYSKDIYKRISACEESYKQLPQFVTNYLKMDGELPPYIPCRDVGPELYMRLGEWEKAERAIKLCIEANAYYPENGEQELSDFKSYRKIATEAILYISENPGCLQRNMYKALPYEGEDKEQLKHFLRHSLQIEKVKYNSTNKLYIKGTAPIISSL